MWPKIQPDKVNRHQLLYPISLFIIGSLLLAGCTTPLETVQEEMNQLRSEIELLRSSMGQLNGRIDTLDQRISRSQSELVQAKDAVPAGAYQELKQAVEVLLKNALESDRRLSSLESMRTTGERSEPRGGQVSRPATEIGGTSQQTRREMKHGMTQEEVRTLFGNPISTAGYSFSTMWSFSGGKSVTFNTAGRVTSWYGS